MLELMAGEYRLVLAPAHGGSIAALEWRGHPLLRPTCGPAITDVACFPLVPFSNRIAWGRFVAGGRTVLIPPNFPGRDHPHPLHGFGWLRPWEVIYSTCSETLMRHIYDGDIWPWAYVAEQRLDLSAAGLRHQLKVTNMSDEPMPAGLGFHPYLPRTPETRYYGLHRGEWQTSEDGLPLSLKCHETALDWWHNRPLNSRVLDTVYEGRVGHLQIVWPEEGLVLTMKPSALLNHTAVLAPSNANFFCVEPITHKTNAINDAENDGGLPLLQSGESLEVELIYAAASLT